MRTTAVDAMLTNIYQQIPQQILEKAYMSTEEDSSLDDQINRKLLIPVVHKDVNILCGKVKTITLTTRDLRPVRHGTFGNQVGMGIESEFYEVDATQRESRDIAFVVGPCQTLSQPYSGGGYVGNNGAMMAGNTVLGNASFLLNSRTFSRAAVAPVFDVAGSNTIRVTPSLQASPFMLDVILGYDYEYSNVEPSVIIALRNLAPIAAKRDIHTRLVIAIDQGEVIAGSEIGVFKDIVSSYDISDDEYNEALFRVQRAGSFDMSRMQTNLYYRI